MKIGIISLYYNNFNLGGLLQSYALVTQLRELGFETEQVCYDLKVTNNISKSYQIKRRLLLIRTSGLKLVLYKIKNIIKRKLKISDHDESLQINLDLQRKVFKEFEHIIPHSRQIYNINTIRDSNKIYDVFIVGSDQVWNLGTLAHDALYLNFANEEKKKITYAVSMGKNAITSFEKKLFLEKIKDFTEIAVREQSLANLIESISDKKCRIVLDPTLLLEYNTWEKIKNDSILPKEKFVFCYFLGDCKWQREVVQKFADTYNLTIIDIPLIIEKKRKSDELLKSEKHYDVGPREFISLIKNAECVFTDSFHAVAFSVNFHTNFYVFDRDGLTGKNSINSRITDFLKITQLSSRRLTSSASILSDEKIDWSKSTQIIDDLRNKSIDWLHEQLLN